MLFDKQAVRRVARSDYARLFEEVWGPGSLDETQDIAGIYERIGRSIAAYERSIEVTAFTPPSMITGVRPLRRATTRQTSARPKVTRQSSILRTS
jgi:hypothetical protein